MEGRGQEGRERMARKRQGILLYLFISSSAFFSSQFSPPSPPILFLFQSRPGDEIFDLNDEQIFFSESEDDDSETETPCKCFGEFRIHTVPMTSYLRQSALFHHIKML